MNNFWDELRTQVEARGFRQYVFNQSMISQDQGDGEYEDDSSAPLTMLQIVRSGFGVPVSRADFPAQCFWDFRRFEKALKSAWDAIDEAARELDPSKNSAITWAFEPPVRSKTELLNLIERAQKKAPNLEAEIFIARPISKWLILPRSLESTLINLLGIVKTHRDFEYGDFLTQVADMKGSNSDLLESIEAKVSRNDWVSAVADNDSLVPPIMVRSYRAWLQNTNSKSQDKSVADFLRVLEGRNNLAGNSTSSILQRLVPLIPKGVDEFPAPLRSAFLKAVQGN
jgi:hypothetical protein